MSIGGNLIWVEQLMAEIFKLVDPRPCYPSLFIRGREVGLVQTIFSYLNKRQEEVLCYHYRDNMSLKEIAAEFIKSRELIQQIKNKALSRLRQPSCADKLRLFFVPSSAEFSGTLKTIEALGEEVSRKNDENQRLRTLLSELGVPEHILEQPNPENIARKLAEEKRRKDELVKFLEGLPASPTTARVKKAVARAMSHLAVNQITSLRQLREISDANKAKNIRGIGVGGQNVLKAAFQELEEKKASP